MTGHKFWLPHWKVKLSRLTHTTTKIRSTWNENKITSGFPRLIFFLSTNTLIVENKFGLYWISSIIMKSLTQIYEWLYFIPNLKLIMICSKKHIFINKKMLRFKKIIYFLLNPNFKSIFSCKTNLAKSFILMKSWFLIQKIKF